MEIQDPRAVKKLRTIAAEIFAGFLNTVSKSLFSLTDPYTRVIVLVHYKGKILLTI